VLYTLFSFIVATSKGITGIDPLPITPTEVVLLYAEKVAAFADIS
jgi:hypothetical protein